MQKPLDAAENYSYSTSTSSTSWSSVIHYLIKTLLSQETLIWSQNYQFYNALMAAIATMNYLKGAPLGELEIEDCCSEKLPQYLQLQQKGQKDLK